MGATTIAANVVAVAMSANLAGTTWAGIVIMFSVMIVILRKPALLLTSGRYGLMVDADLERTCGLMMMMMTTGLVELCLL